MALFRNVMLLLLATMAWTLPLESVEQADNDLVARAGATVYLIGDSTMAKGGGGSGTDGWGQYLQKYLPGATIFNHAVGGRSFRSFTEQGRFDAVAAAVKPGNWVVMEFGHNEHGSLRNDNGRTACPGEGSEICKVGSKTVLTFNAYAKNAATKMLAKGAQVIISSQTPYDICETGTCVVPAPDNGVNRFANQAKLVVDQLGGPAKGVYFVPHGEAAIARLKALGPAVVNKGYHLPGDHTHTLPAMADVMAETFDAAVKQAGVPLY